MTGAAAVRGRLRSALTKALKARDRVTVSAVRSALAALDNAEAVPTYSSASPPAAGSEHVAGAVQGLGATEVARRELTGAQVGEVLEAMVEQWLTLAGTYESSHPDEAGRLRAEAAALRAVLDGP